MMPGTLAREALRALTVNRLRSALTMLGIVIGVGAVVMMLAIGRGAQETVNRSIAAMGSNIVIVLSGATTSGGLRFGTGTAPTLTVSDAEAMTDLPSVAAVAPVVSGSAQFIHGAANWSTFVYGTTPTYLPVRDWTIAAGQSFTDAELRGATRVVLLGATVARSLFGEEDPLGKTVRIKNSPFLVIGVLEAKGQTLDGRDQDDTAIVPLTTAQRQLFGQQFPGAVRYISVKARSAGALEDAQRELTALLRQRHRLGLNQEDDFTVRNLAAVAETAAGAARVMSLMLGAIASISLVVGGIGIMNIMLVSVTERTREIGIRMAVGARPRDILRQFLLEALTLCVLGSVAGVAVGVGGAAIARLFTGMTIVVTAASVLLAVVVAAGIGIFFGWYPARQAARLRPIEALRHE